jgi:hypothetical protein
MKPQNPTMILALLGFDFLLPDGKMNSIKPQGVVSILTYHNLETPSSESGKMGNYKYVKIL